METTPTYRLALGLGALAMLLLPLLYVMLIGVVGYLVQYHLLHHTALITSVGRGRAVIVGLLLYLAPLASGGILVAFMVKPIFARRVSFERGRSLTRTNEPLLFAFVDRICQVIGAPRPVRIDIDCQVNAAAGFRRGMLSMFGSDLVLLIGMPLVAGLNLRQFAGVLGHEFGHFSQGAGMRLSYVIRAISGWLTRVVYERDAWDDWLAQTAADTDLRIGWVLYLAMLCVWLTRKILWVFMLAGHVISSYLLREMEFDADRHEARLVGREAFRSTTRQMALLNVASDRALSDLGEYYRDGRLTDNLPSQIVASIPLLPAVVNQLLEKHERETRTGWFDTHPASRDRLASVDRENEPGTFHLDCPATDLFANFPAAARGVTLDLYRAAFGAALDPSAIRPFSELLAHQAQQQKSQAALDRYSQGTFHVLRPIRLSSAWLGAPDNPRQNLERIKQCRQELLERKSSYAQSAAEFDSADSLTIEIAQAGALLAADIKVAPSTFSLRLSSRAEVRAARDRVETTRGRAASEMRAVQDLLGERLIATFELLSVDQVAKRLPQVDELREEARQLLATAHFLGRMYEERLELRSLVASLSALVSQLQPQEQRSGLLQQIVSLMRQAPQKLADVRSHLDREQYPFDHARGMITLAGYALPVLPESDDLGAIAGASSQLLDTLASLEIRVFSQLASTAEQVESAAFGLKPLPRTASANLPQPDGAAAVVDRL